MTFEQWPEGHQVVMTAFGKHLPEGDELATMARSLDRMAKWIRPDSRGGR